MAVQETPGTQERLRRLRRVDLAQAGAGGAPRTRPNGNGTHLRAVAPPALSDQAIARRAATAMAQATLVASCAETAAHCHDVDVISEGICRHLGVAGEDRERIMAAARLHDVGKVAIPAEILDKPAPLNEREWEIMRAHTIIGEEIVGAVPELTDVAPLVRHSHERWDGRGYPDGLAGEEIPLGARIVFCADAFHAIRSDRPYRRGRTATQAFKELKACAGTQFDPAVVTALGGLMHEMRIETRRTGLGQRSSRLVALLMILACGVGGSAVARSGLLDSPDVAAASPAAPHVLPAQDSAPGALLPGGGVADLAAPSSAKASSSGSEPRETGEPAGSDRGGAVGTGVERAAPGTGAFSDSPEGGANSPESGAKTGGDGRGSGGTSGDGRTAAQDAPAGGDGAQGSPAQGGAQGGEKSPGGGDGGAEGHSKDKAHGNANGHGGTSSSGGQGQGRSGSPPGNSGQAPGSPGHVPPAGSGGTGGPPATQGGHGGGRPGEADVPPAPKQTKPPKPELPAPAVEPAPALQGAGAAGKPPK